MREVDYERAAPDLALHAARERELIAAERRPAGVQMRLARLTSLLALVAALRDRIARQ